jgi:hypothetical protein
MRQVRLLIFVGGIFLPYVAGMINSSLPMSWGSILFLGAFNSIIWGSVLLATAGYRHAISAAYPALLGFAWPTLYYLSFGSKSSPIGLVFLPVENLLFVLIGWLVGRHFDREMSLE